MKDIYHFKMKSESSGSIYELIINFSPTLTIDCDCEAKLGMYLCKHIISIFDNNTKLLANTSQIKLFNELSNDERLSETIEAYKILKKELVNYDIEIKRLRGEKTKLKRSFRIKLLRG